MGISGESTPDDKGSEGKGVSNHDVETIRFPMEHVWHPDRESLPPETIRLLRLQHQADYPQPLYSHQVKCQKDCPNPP